MFKEESEGQTYYDSEEQLLGEFRQKYSEAYKGILPVSILKQGNKWFEAFISKSFRAGKKEGKIVERNEWILGNRCRMCGGEMKATGLADTCAKCFEDN